MQCHNLQPMKVINEPRMIIIALSTGYWAISHFTYYNFDRYGEHGIIG